MEGPPCGDVCSVCHGNFNIPCQANCSHWFCGNCIMLVWDHGSTLQACRCPLCRRRITLLIPTDDSLRQRHDPAVGDILQKVESYNRIFGGPTTANGFFQIGVDYISSHYQKNPIRTPVPYFSIPSFQYREAIAVRIQDLPFLLRRLVRELVDPRRSLPLVIRARVYIAMILSAAYIFSPIDIIPEAVLGIVGLLDDLLIALMCFLHVAALYRAVLYNRHGGA
ncbi:E3 ubiquitin-protein ligase RNF170 [Citrus sinensis]|uniref:E3 ubiquitin-protein ligase RNF170 n=1 Tax=Citrus sinensis TaxID=2711 RepID=A0ACB8KUE9_CITSI|nr:E3 ubiquitin-protein ligase RNF170 [Citrus sinensis]